MRILHTADWHLGRRFDQMEITVEHNFFLNWLIDTIDEQRIDVLIVAGDIFDSGSPSNTALKQYYDFLWRVKATKCTSVIIIGGNHDSVSTLNAPKDLLKYLHVHVVGGVPDDITDAIIQVPNKDGTTGLVVCAIPFLRDRDIRLSISGETSAEREARIKEGIAEHYRQHVPHILGHKQQQIPVIATGHLFASGAITSSSEKDIHVGNLGQIGSEGFPAEFDYIALGHLHRPQLVNGKPHIRYSGSPVALSFSEADHVKMVVVLDIEQAALSIEEIVVPCYRKLYNIKGREEAVKTKLSALADEGNVLPVWVDVEVETDSYLQRIEEELNKIKAGKPFIESLTIRQKRISKMTGLKEEAADGQTLSELGPKAVFQMKCMSTFPDAEIAGLIATFDEAMELMEQQDMLKGTIL